MLSWLRKTCWQLYLLLWRNAVIRWRVGSVTVAKKFRIPMFQLLEVLWPLLLYLILAGLAHRFPPTQRGDQVYRPYAMPSAGFLPFLQTVMCDLGDDDKGGVFSDLPTYPNATLNEIYPVLDEVGSWNVSWTNLCDSFHSLAAQRNCLAATNSQDPRCREAAPEEVPLTCYLKNSTEFMLFLRDQLQLSPSLVQQVMTATVDSSKLPGNGGSIDEDLLGSLASVLGGSGGGGLDLSGLLGFPGGLAGGGGLPSFLPGTGGSSGSSLQFLVCNTSSLGTILHFTNISLRDVQSEVCGLSPSQWQLLAEELQRQSVATCDSAVLSGAVSQVVSVQRLLEDSGFVEVLRSFAEVDAELGNAGEGNCVDDGTGQTSCRGNSSVFFCGPTRRDFGRVLRILRGSYQSTNTNTSDQDSSFRNASASPDLNVVKVLYTPMNNLTLSIMKKANRTFDTVAQLIALADQVRNCSQFFLDNFDPDSLSGVRQTLSDVIAYRMGVPGFSVGTRYLANLYSNVSIGDLQRTLDFINASSPNNIWSVMRTVRGVASEISDTLSVLNWDIFMGVASEDAMVRLFSDRQRQLDLNITYLAAGVVFDGVPASGEKGVTGGRVFKNATIRIRTNFSAVVDPTELMDVIWHPGPENTFWKKRYFTGLIIFLQDMLERATVEQIAGRRLASPGVYVQRMPYPCHLDNRFVVSLQFVLPLAMLFSWLFPVAMTTRAVVREKEVRLKEFMKMMGVGEGLLRLSWFLNSFLTLEVSVLCIVLVLKYGGIVTASNSVLIFLYLSVYAMSMLGYSFLISVFFINANLAACVAALTYFMVFFAHLPLLPYMRVLNAPSLALVCLWSPLAFALGGTYIAQWELMQVGLQWSNVLSAPTLDDHLAFVGISLMLLFDLVLYLTLAWYIEGVFPGRYGVAKPWYFPLQPSYWFGQGNYKCHTHFLSWCAGLWGRVKGDELRLLPEEDEQEMSKLADSSGDDDELSRHCEDEPEGLPLGIAIENLTKTFKTGWLPWKQQKVCAVNKLNMRFYEGQITAFLGHNGAGKTTTLSLLTGLFEPTSGTAHIYGNSIRSDMDTIRQSLGICPQHNILFDELTIEEHLLFYGQLKGLKRSEAVQQVPQWLEKVELSGHGNKLAKHLSGGMKRKLSILLAFVGKCRTIILDEPTSGVDPFARRQIWDFLLRNKDGRTIVLCTHHMDEAEMLGDRIAIVSQGSLLCSGTFEYLKHKYGRGHRLTLVTQLDVDRRSPGPAHSFTVTADIEDVDTELPVEPGDTSAPPTKQSRSPSPGDSQQTILEFIKGQIVGAELVETRGCELHVLLPLLQARPRVLAQLFAELDRSKDALGVASYGMTACSMEEIFMQLTEKELLAKADANLAEAFAPRPTLHSDSRTSFDSTLLAPRTAEATPTDQVDHGRESTEHAGSTASAEKDSLQEEEEAVLFGDESRDDLLGDSGSHGDGGARLRRWWLQFYASMVRRVLHMRSAILAMLIQNILPLLVILLGLIIARALQVVPDSPSLELSPHMFFARADYNYMFVGGAYNNETVTMADSFFRPCGVGAHTTGSPNDPTSLCYQGNDWSPEAHQCPVRDYPQDQYNCKCPPRLLYSCNHSNLVSSGVPGCFNGTGTGTRVLNVTTTEDEDFDYELLNYILRSTDAFTLARYGGASFGHVKEDVDDGIDSLNSDPTLTLPFLATRKAAKAWHTLKGYHAAPAYLNTLNNAILRGNLDNVSRQEQSEYGVRTISNPFALTELEKVYYALSENSLFLVHPLSCVFALGFVIAGFALLLIEERATGIKHVQLVCGINRGVYWLCAYVWDFLWFCGFCLLLILLFVFFRDPTYVVPSNLPVFILILIFYGMAAIPWIYMFSFLFTSPATAYVLLFCLNFFSGFACLMVDFILVQLDSNSDAISTGLLQYTLVWVPFPAYGLGRCMMFLSLDLPLSQFLEAAYGANVNTAYSKLWPFFLSLFFQGLLYSLVVLLMECWPAIRNKCIRRKNLSLPVPEGEDDEVRKERDSVMADTSDDLLVLRNLTKIYGTRCSSQYRLAVNQLCLRVEKGECFGLLGVNGAGKTSTFRMLTGDIHKTSGESVISSTHNLGGNVSGGALVGYCPQVDALMDGLTGRQQLTFYCRLRGMSGAELRRVVGWTLTHLQLQEYADKPANTYSGGNRRKLSTAIALLAKPSLILLDEPTSGVDPLARRFLWSVVRGVVSQGQSVVLTTHSMAECEALCSRVGIMVNGSFRCLGSIQQLKHTYGEGYRLKIRVTGSNEQVKEFIQHNFVTAVLKEEHYISLVYQLPSEGLHLSSIYDTMEDARQNLNILDYSLSQTTLDDVFIHFANEQSEEAGLATMGVVPSVARQPASASAAATLPDIVPSSASESTAV